jgi:hypothetical protein
MHLPTDIVEVDDDEDAVQVISSPWLWKDVVLIFKQTVDAEASPYAGNSKKMDILPGMLNLLKPAVGESRPV